MNAESSKSEKYIRGITTCDGGCFVVHYYMFDEIGDLWDYNSPRLRMNELIEFLQGVKVINKAK